MKQIVKLISTQPLLILCNKMNRNISKQKWPNINSDLSRSQSKFKSKTAQKLFIPHNSLQLVFKKILLNAIKKCHLNVSQNWISNKYLFFIFTYKIKWSGDMTICQCWQSKNLKLNHRPFSRFGPIFEKKFSLKISRKVLFSFIYSTNKLQVILNKFFLSKKLKTVTPKMFSIKNLQPLIKKNNCIEPIESNKFNILKTQFENNQKMLQAGSGSTFLVLVNLNCSQLTQNLNVYSKKIKCLSHKKNLLYLWNSQPNDLSFQQAKNMKLQNKKNLFRFFKNASQILTTFFLYQKNHFFLLEKKVSSKDKIKCLLKTNEFDIKRNQLKKDEFKSKEKLFISNYPVFFDFQAKLTSIQTSHNNDNKIISNFANELIK